MERVLLPLQVVGLHLLELVLRRRQAPLLEGEGQHGLAERGDGVMERGVVRGSVRLRHVLGGGGSRRKDPNFAILLGSRSSFVEVREWIEAAIFVGFCVLEDFEREEGVLSVLC